MCLVMMTVYAEVAGVHSSGSAGLLPADHLAQVLARIRESAPKRGARRQVAVGPQR